METGNSISRRLRRSRAGMTLLEIMIASGIMATALVLLMGSLASITATGASSEERAVAASHVSSILEEVGRSDLSTLATYQPPGFRGLRNEVVTVSVIDGNGTALPLPIAGSIPTNIPNPVEIRVVVAWEGKSGHPYRMAATTVHRW